MDSLHQFSKNNLPTSDDRQIDLLIASWLRIGVFIAFVITIIGGIIYLTAHGKEPIQDYTQFSYQHLPAGYQDYTTFKGIWEGIKNFTATGWIQMGVLMLFLTPIIRVFLSLVDFVTQRDYIYICICSIVLAIIIFNSITPML